MIEPVNDSVSQFKHFHSKCIDSDANNRVQHVSHLKGFTLSTTEVRTWPIMPFSLSELLWAL